MANLVGAVTDDLDILFVGVVPPKDREQLFELRRHGLSLRGHVVMRRAKFDALKRNRVIGHLLLNVTRQAIAESVAIALKGFSQNVHLVR